MVDCPFARGWASVQRACGLHGNRRRQPTWLPLFRRASRVYVALDRDATGRAIALARTFGTRGASSSRRRNLARKAISTTGWGRW